MKIIHGPMFLEQPEPEPEPAAWDIHDTDQLSCTSENCAPASLQFLLEIKGFDLLVAFLNCRGVSVWPADLADEITAFLRRAEIGNAPRLDKSQIPETCDRRLGSTDSGGRSRARRWAITILVSFHAPGQ